MSRLRLFLSFLLAGVTLAGLSRSALAGEPQWIEVRSPHFSVVTDAGERRGREVALRFEQMRAVFGTLMVKANVNLAIPLQIVAFRNTKELRQFSPLWNGKPTELAGLFQGGTDRSFIMLDMSTEDPWKVVFHEYAHQLMDGNLSAQTAPWFEEGFAEYFSSIEVDNKQARVGKVPDQDYRILQQEGTMKIADLFLVQHDSKTYNESGDHRTVFYAESGMVVHYLYDNQLIPKLPDYFIATVDQKRPVEEAVKQAFGMDVQQFDKALRNYVLSGHYRYYAIPTPAGIADSKYSVAALSSADASAILADVHLHSRDYRAKSIGEFEAVLKTNPNHAASMRGLGYAYLQQHDFEKAGEYFRRSAEADSKDPRVHYYSALLMNQEGAFTRDPKKIALMKKELETSIALDPNFADAYSLLAFARMASGEQEQAVQALEKALAISPRNENYQLNLAMLYLSGREMDKAMGLLAALRNSANPGVASRAQSLSSQVEAMKTARLEYGSDSAMVHRVPAEHPSDPQTEGEEASKAEVRVIPSSGPPKFLKGTLVKVDCSTTPQAWLTVVSGKKTWTMKIADTKHAIVIGADSFSCDWANQKVALNYHETVDGEGTVMSVEIQ